MIISESSKHDNDKLSKLENKKLKYRLKANTLRQRLIDEEDELRDSTRQMIEDQISFCDDEYNILNQQISNQLGLDIELDQTN